MIQIAGLCFLFASVLASTPTSTPPYQSCNPNLLDVDCILTGLAPSYAFCNTTTKHCQCRPGFTGGATVSNPCTCSTEVYFSADLTILNVFDFGTPVCFDYSDYLSLTTDSQTQENHINSVLTFLGNTIYPKPVAILATLGVGTLNSILTPNCTSRISPVGNFNGFQGVVEYFYGFVAAPGFVAKSLDVREIAAQGNTVAAKANLFLNNSNYAFSGGYPPQYFNLSLFCFFTFESNGLISSIDVSVPNLGFLLDIPPTNPYYSAIHNATINATCALLTLNISNPTPYPGIKNNGTCGGTVYDGAWAGSTQILRYEDCVKFYLYDIPYGTHNRINSNTVVCRTTHAPLTLFSPDVHCVHTGKTGGDSCIDFTYASFFAVDY